jgi:hypothetical protein
MLKRRFFTIRVGKRSGGFLLFDFCCIVIRFLASELELPIDYSPPNDQEGDED